MTSPLELYGEDLLLATGGPGGSTGGGTAGGTWLRTDDGTDVPLDLPRWTAPAAGADEALLERCTAPTLDLGCGPGRLTRALVARGLDCLGVDVAPVAVALARTGGTPVLHASAFDPVLDATRWGTVLLADGNIGIGGDPVALLRRCGALLAPGGRVLAELDPPSARTRTVRARIESSAGRTSRHFWWAQVSAGDVVGVAAAAGLHAVQVWQAGGRWFAQLETTEEDRRARHDPATGP